ncbi:cohesin domain-containing protein [Lewinella cohaerens]|uniref:cohesin domain-containing protein n=1 Tax=Lewinella cohaerens TaxID=70995 RepID=UPI0003663DD4|nr:cohesin domain-containing protein [Lewinella cohaerens]
MKFQLSQCFGVVALLLVSLSLTAQDAPSIYINDNEVEPGQTIDVDVLTADFNEIISSSFNVAWDSMMLRYVGVSNIALGLSEDDNFNLITAGEVNYLYFDNSLEGNTLSNGTPLFTLQLEVIGADGEQTEVDFAGLMEVVDTSETDIGGEFLGGLITIGEVSSTSIATESPLQAEVSPNPFSETANVIIELNEGGEISWTLSEISGQRVMEGKTFFGPGSNVLKLENTLFKHTGAYILQLQMGDVSITQRLLYVAP